MENFDAEEEGVMAILLGAHSIESIRETFYRATTSLNSPASFNRESGGCVQDNGPSNGELHDELLGFGEILPPARPFCGNEGNEAGSECAKDDVVVIGAGGGMMDTDRVLVVGGDGDEGEGIESGFGGERGCIIDGDLFLGEKSGYDSEGCMDEDDENKDGPILIEDLF